MEATHKEETNKIMSSLLPISQSQLIPLPPNFQKKEKKKNYLIF